jgi:hypothetical protein
MSEEYLNKKDVDGQTIIFPESEIKYLYACGDENREIAKFFEHKNEYGSRYLKKIRVYADCRTEKAEFKIKICDLNSNNEPGLIVHEERFVAKEGSFWIEKDVVNTKIVVPKNGLFLVVDWIKSEENKHEVNSHRRNGEMKIQISYEPCIGSFPSMKNNTWLMLNGKWKKDELINLPLVKYRGSYSDLAIELEF